MKISIIIINYNTQKLLADCLKSIYQNQPKFKFEIIVADNASQDGSSEMVKQDFPKARLLKNKSNLGFARANNQAAKISRGEYLLFLNSDTIIVNQALEKMADFLDQNSQIGIIGPKLVSKNHRVQSHIIGYQLDLWGSLKNKLMEFLGKFFSESKGFQKIASHWNLEYWGWSKPRSVDWVTGAALMVRKKLFSQIHGFDAKFFMYFEDQDLCLKAKKRNYQIYALPKAKIIHLSGQSFKDNFERLKAYRQSQKYFIIKNFGAFQEIIFRYLRKIVQN